MLPHMASLSISKYSLYVHPCKICTGDPPYIKWVTLTGIGCHGEEKDQENGPKI